MITQRSIRVAGSIHMDVVVTVDRFPLPGETFRGKDWVLRPGGKGRNQAVSAACHYDHVYMMGAVGGDQFAPALIESFVEANVNVDAVIEVEGDVSGGSVALIEPAGDSESVIVSGVNLRIPDTTIQNFVSNIRQGDVLVLQNEITTEANEWIASSAQARGGTVVLNAAPYRALTARIQESVDVLVVNEVEAQQYSGIEVTTVEQSKEAADKILNAWNCSAVIITLGKDGVVYSTSDSGSKRIAALPVVSNDAHGAGDGFVGGLVAQIAKGRSMDEAVRYANATAGVIVSTPFDERGRVGPSDVQELLSNQ